MNNIDSKEDVLKEIQSLSSLIPSTLSSSAPPLQLEYPSELITSKEAIDVFAAFLHRRRHYHNRLLKMSIACLPLSAAMTPLPGYH
jgi:hypothetical protein